MLSLTYQDGFIRGHTVVELAVEAAVAQTDPIGSISYSYPILGRAEMKSGQLQIEFLVADEENRSMSTALLRSDNTHLDGQISTGLPGSDGSSATTYQWVARRAR